MGFKLAPIPPHIQWRLDNHRAETTRLRSLTTEDFLAEAIHTLHNCQRRDVTDTVVYDGARDLRIVPEMFRRMNGGKTPETCPVCKQKTGWRDAGDVEMKEER